MTNLILWHKLPVSETELNLSIVLRCGQTFRWKNINNVWTFATKDRILLLKQEPPPPTTTTTRERFYRIFTYNEKRQERYIQRHAFVDFRLFYIRHEVARLVCFVESQWQEVQHHHFQVRLTYRNTYVATRSVGVFDLIYLLIKQQRQKDIQNV